MSPRVVQISLGTAPDGGGAARFAGELARALARWCARKSIDFSVLELAGDAPEVDVAGEPASPFARRGFRGRQARLALTLALAQRRADLLIFDHLGPARLQGWLPKAFRAPYAIFLLGIEVWRPLSRDRRRALSGARRVFAISHETLRRARPFLPAGLCAEVLAPGIDDTLPSAPPDAEILQRAGEDFVLIVGRMDPRERYKGHDELLAAWTLLLAAQPGARLVVVGDGADRARLEAVARDARLGDRVVFLGRVDEATLVELYRRCRLLALPSRGEGFGLVYVEAMRAGRPCLGLAGTTAEEVFAPEVEGVVVRTPLADELAGAVARLLGDPGLAARLGRAARERYERDHSARAFARRLDERMDLLWEERTPADVRY